MGGGGEQTRDAAAYKLERSSIESPYDARTLRLFWLVPSHTRLVTIVSFVTG